MSDTSIFDNLMSPTTSSNMSDSYPLNQVEINLLRAITKPIHLDKQIFLKEFSKYNLFFSYKIYPQIQSKQSKFVKLSTKSFNHLNKLAVKYLNKSLNDIPHMSTSNRPKRPPTPPGPLFKKVKEQKLLTRKRIVIHTKRLPPPPTLVVRGSKALIVEGCLPKSEIKRKLQAKLDPLNASNLLLECNIPNIKFKFRIEI